MWLTNDCLEVVTYQLAFLFKLSKDELLGLAEDGNGDPIYRSPSLDMDVLYRSGETQQVFSVHANFFFRDYVFYFHTKGSLVDNLFISHSSFIFLKPFFLKLHNIIARTSVFACDVV